MSGARVGVGVDVLCEVGVACMVGIVCEVGVMCVVGVVPALHETTNKRSMLRMMEELVDGLCREMCRIVSPPGRQHVPLKVFENWLRESLLR